jgi:indolepyruvate ferredoxin oxidoreductase
VTAKLSIANHAPAVALASVPDEILGYGHVKEKSLAAAKALRAPRLQAFQVPQPVRIAA